MIYDLPTKLEFCGKPYEIRSDYRAVLDICTALTDPDLSGEEKVYVTLGIFYPEFKKMPPEHYQDAITQCFWFINCGSEEENTRKSPKLMDWEQDFQYIVAPVNRVLNTEIRDVEYLHWWSFISAYYEIGDCLFAQIVRIRNLKAKGKPLDKVDAQWYRENRHMVDIKQTFSESEKAILKEWGV